MNSLLPSTQVIDLDIDSERAIDDIVKPMPILYTDDAGNEVDSLGNPLKPKGYYQQFIDLMNDVYHSIFG